MKRVDIPFCFKGGRQYIHGTDMLDKGAEFLEGEFGAPLEELEFVIHAMTSRNLLLYVYPARSAPVNTASQIAELKFKVADKSWDARYFESSDIPDCRYAYDEDVVVDICTLSILERKIVLQQEAPHSEIETLVAMTKVLHRNIFPHAEGSWVFCRWSSPRWPLSNSLKGVSVKLIHSLGTRLTRSEVSLEGKVLGYIYFSARLSK